MASKKPIIDRCPRCGSTKMIKCGRKFVRGANRQKYQCQSCGHYHIEGSETGKYQGGK